MKINILYLIATLEIGGAERQLIELVKRIDKNKFNPVVCCLTRGGPLEDELKQAKVEYFILGKKFKLDFSIIFKLVFLLKQKNIHILHTWMFTSNSFGRIAAILVHTPIIIASERSIYRKNKLEFFIDYILSHFTDRIICVSEGVKSFYHKYAGIPFNKLVTIYSGIDVNGETDISKDVRKELSPEENISVITTIGHLVPYKGIKYLLYAAVEIIRNFPDVRFLIVGEGPQKDKLDKLAKELGIDSYIVFTGLRRDIKGILAITDIFVSASLIEGLPNVIMEAMFAGNPVVATHIPGNDELVIDGKTGLVIPPKDADSLASAVIALLKEPEKGRKMGINGRQRIEKYFSINETVEKTEGLYKTLVKLKLYKKQNG